MVLQDIFEKLKLEHARSQAKHGKWTEVRSMDQRNAIQDEFEEWLYAFYTGDVTGPHGEIAEALQVMNVMARRIMYLTGEDA